MEVEEEIGAFVKSGPDVLSVLALACEVPKSNPGKHNYLWVLNTPLPLQTHTQTHTHTLNLPKVVISSLHSVPERADKQSQLACGRDTILACLLLS